MTAWLSRPFGPSLASAMPWASNSPKMHTTPAYTHLPSQSHSRRIQSLHPYTSQTSLLTNFSWPSCCKHASGRGLCKHVQSVKTNLLLLQILHPIHLLHRLATPTAAQQSKALHPTLRQLPMYVASAPSTSYVPQAITDGAPPGARSARFRSAKVS
jgi:hypothetical protein